MRHARAHSLPLLLTLLSLSCAEPGPAAPEVWVVDRPRFLLFGDSLTERAHAGATGWASALAHVYNRKVDVLLRGFGGYNTRWALETLGPIFKSCNAENTMLVTIFLGANDAAMPQGPMNCEHQHIPLPEYKENLKQIIAHVRRTGVTNIVLLTPPPLYETGRRDTLTWIHGAAKAAGMTLDRYNNNTQLYAEGCKQVGEDVGVPVIDLWTSIQKEREWGPRCFVKDGLHFSSTGNMHVFNALIKTVGEHFPALVAGDMHSQFPIFKDINWLDPASSFTLVDQKDA